MNEERSRLLGHPFVARAARWGVVAWAIIGILVIGFILLRYVLAPIAIVFPPIVVALIAVYFLNPIVRRLEKRGIPRGWGALITYLVFVTIVVVGLRFLIPVIVRQAESFGSSVNELVASIRHGLASLADRFGFEVAPGTVLPGGSGPAVARFLGQLFSFARGLLQASFAVILGLVLGFYLLVDLPKVQRGIDALIPERRRAEFQELFGRLGKAVGGFFRGQLLVALFVGLASSLALFIVGLPFWALVGMVAGLFNLIPLIGPFIGGGLAALVAFTTPVSGGGLLHLQPGWPLALGSAVALTIVQQIDNHIISPNIVARTVKLHPITVMLALVVGGTLLGLWGMLLAVPVVASVKVLMLHYWDTRMRWPPVAEAGRTGTGTGPSAPPGDRAPEPPEPATVARSPGSRAGGPSGSTGSGGVKGSASGNGPGRSGPTERAGLGAALRRWLRWFGRREQERDTERAGEKAMDQRQDVPERPPEPSAPPRTSRPR